MRIQPQRDAFAYRVAAGPDAPHEDWQQHRGNAFKWHPPYGETHVKYHVYPMGGGRNPVVWTANHHGTYQGVKTVSPPQGYPAAVPDFDVPVYSGEDEPDRIGRFKTPAKAKAAAEQHYADNYGKPQKGIGDYDINQLMRDEGF